MILLMTSLNKTTMRAYWFELLDEDYNDLGIFIKDGSNKKVAINAAKREMRERGIKTAKLSVNSMRTSDLLDVISIEIK